MKIREELKKELARRSYADYCVYVHNGNWILGKHLKLICKTVEDLIFDRIPQKILILSVPPQHGKSQCVTETLPSYYLGKFPNKRVIEVSYGDDLAQRFGRRNKDKINEFGFNLFDIKISKERNSATDFEIENHKGSMISRGIMSGITGQPGDLIIIDDPIKNRQEADSETYRERLWDEFLNSINTRLSAKGKIILIMTRWHEDDLAGRMLKNMPEKCLEINIPLESEDNDILGRNKGEALFPEIGKDDEWLREFKKDYVTSEGSRAWNALMQGHPTAQEGNMLKRHWWKFYETLPEWIDECIQSWDCTFKDSDGSDFVVGQVWARAGACYYLVDQFRDRMDLPTTIQAILNMSEKHPRATLKLVEDKANGPAVIQLLQTRLPGLVAINPDGGKITRASAVSPAIESGNVFLPMPMGNTWVNDFIDECSAFPNGSHDDMVDSMSQALNRLIYYSKSNKPQERKYPINSMEERVQKNLEKLTNPKRRKGSDFL